MTPAKATQPAHAVGWSSYRVSVSDLLCEVSVMYLSS
jgi:hypothetical protein